MTIKLPRPDLAAYALCGLCIAGIILLTALRIGDAGVLEFLKFTSAGALGIGGGTALNVGSPAAAPAPAPAPAPVAAPAAPPAAIAGTTTDPAATGVFRVATHG